jgi:hypothetical protein
MTLIQDCQILSNAIKLDGLPVDKTYKQELMRVLVANKVALSKMKECKKMSIEFKYSKRFFNVKVE